MQHRVGLLPDAALVAAARFYAVELPVIAGKLHGDSADLTLIFLSADHAHHAWRLAAIQDLARQYAPRRINALVSTDETAIAAALAYLAEAQGITGQLLMLDSIGAGDMIQSDNDHTRTPD